MAKLTIEIDMNDSQETWDSLYRRIETLGAGGTDEPVKPTAPTPSAATYDLLLDPERAFGDVNDFFAAFSGQD